jgi:mono/diheme cytochrome c family protein
MNRLVQLGIVACSVCVGCSAGKEGSSEIVAPNSSSSLAASYATVQSIFDRKCIPCHGTANPKEGVSLVSHEALMKGGEQGATVVPGDPENSLLIQVLRGTNGKKLMPMGSSALPEQDIKAVEAWIKDGAKP